MLTSNNNYCSHCHQSPVVPLRSTWARAALNKIENDRCLKRIDRSVWYRLPNPDLLQNEYRECFQELYEDEETTKFIKQSIEKSDNVPLQIIQSILTSLLTLFITRTSGMKFRLVSSLFEILSFLSS